MRACEVETCGQVGLAWMMTNDDIQASASAVRPARSPPLLSRNVKVRARFGASLDRPARQQMSTSRSLSSMPPQFWGDLVGRRYSSKLRAAARASSACHCPFLGSAQFWAYPMPSILRRSSICTPNSVGAELRTGWVHAVGAYPRSVLDLALHDFMQGGPQCGHPSKGRHSVPTLGPSAPTVLAPSTRCAVS